MDKEYDGTVSVAQSCGGDTDAVSDKYQANQRDDQICAEIIEGNRDREAIGRCN